MNIVYMGTPEFAVNALDAIVADGHNVMACFTQPDKPKGRGKNLAKSPVKIACERYDIQVYQPVKLREPENIEIIRELAPDCIVVAAYGQILPESILNIPKYGCINIHASLLPKYRGAAPIEWSIIDGCDRTGVTTMYMSKGLDKGDMILKSEVEISDSETGEELRGRLAVVGAELIVKTLHQLEDGTAVRIPQNDEESSYASMLNKEMGRLDFTMSAHKINCLIRGLQPWPCVYTRVAGKGVKIYEAEVCDTDESLGADVVPGMITAVTKKSFTIACGEGTLKIKRLQPEGKKVMDAAAFLPGNKLNPGDMAGE